MSRGTPKGLLLNLRGALLQLKSPHESLLPLRRVLIHRLYILTTAAFVLTKKCPSWRLDCCFTHLSLLYVKVKAASKYVDVPVSESHFSVCLFMCANQSLNISLPHYNMHSSFVLEMLPLPPSNVWLSFKHLVVWGRRRLTFPSAACVCFSRMYKYLTMLSHVEP